jgi:hypothetical protein
MSEDVFDTEAYGRRITVVAPALAEDYPPRVNEGLARRRRVLLGHRCPCG